MGGKFGKALEPYRDVGILCLRLAIGTIFMAHGSQMLFGWFGGWGLAATVKGFAAMGFQPAWLWATLAAATQFFGGLAVLVGFGTRLAAFLLGIVMVVAMVKVHLPNGFFLNWMGKPGVGHGIEYNVALLGGCLALFFGGSGRFALGCAACQCEKK